eukprot:TRINITY_DN1289_c0_g1_i2.p1 TRINITY_DN1289_c0_g1~~TRINITY_DN1289_c0_g1_i2.p1  ORF type:complete len:827 (-),score=122.18 TRINITY_DN1289_c0_g1_i2:1196-3313(-)
MCVDIPANENFTCIEQREFGQCDAPWMVENRFCEFTCGRCPCLLEPSASCMQYALNDLPAASTMLGIINGSSIQMELLNSVASSGATYFIPSNSAWEQFGTSVPNSEALFGNQQLLAEFIGYHIVSASADDADALIQKGAVSTSHLQEEISVERQGRRDVILKDQNGREAQVVSNDLETCGSFVHIIDNVLIPSQTSIPFQCLQFALGSSEDTMGMLELITSSPRLSELLQEAVQEPRTLFIPSTQAWQEYRESLHMPELLFEEDDLLAEYISLHIVMDAGNLAVIEGEAESMHMGEELDIDSEAGTVSVGGAPAATIIRRNVKACNSVINVIDKVLIPTSTDAPFECLLQALGSSEETASLINLANISNIVRAVIQVAAQTPHTFFIPSTDAWLDLLNNMELPGTLLDSDELLAEVVSYHIAKDSYSINELLIAGNITTNHLGESLSILTSDGPEAFLMDTNGREAMVTTPDMMVCNSTVNIIDRVLIPSLTSSPDDCLQFAFETLPGTGEFSKLVQASPSFLELLKDISVTPHTFLIPSNVAVKDFYSLLVNKEALSEDTTALEELIRFHIVQGNLNTQQLFEAGDIETLLFEEPIEFEFSTGFDISRRELLSRTSAIIMPDIKICNTTVHVIDAVLYPAITSIQDLLDSDVGIFRSLIEIPNEPLITFQSLRLTGDAILGEEEEDEDEVFSPAAESIMDIEF